MFCLVDFDPDGIGIMSTYAYGSITLSHQSQTLAVPSISWLGVQSEDLPTEDFSRVGLLRLSSRDRRMATRMLERSAFQEGKGAEWRRELQVMLMLNYKAEIQILSDGAAGLEDWLNMKLARELNNGQF